MPEVIQTSDFARRTGRKSASIRTAVWRNGHFNGIKPLRLPNGRLLWPLAEVEALVSASGNRPSPRNTQDVAARLAAGRVAAAKARAVHRGIGPK